MAFDRHRTKPFHGRCALALRRQGPPRKGGSRIARTAAWRGALACAPLGFTSLAVDCAPNPELAPATACPLLRHRPVLVPVERGHPQGEPPDRAERGEDRGEVSAVAAADHADRRRVDARPAGRHVIRRDEVAQVVLAGDGLVPGVVPRDAARFEGQADAAERRDWRVRGR
jgi:hypothetical protein